MRSDDYALMDEGNYLRREIVPHKGTDNMVIYTKSSSSLG